MMDYKELIKKLREKDGCNCECLQAADTIETILEERDSAVELLRAGKSRCDCCMHDESSIHEYPCRDCKDCGGMSDYWQWRGPQKGDAQ